MVQIILYVLILYMTFRLITLQKRSKKNTKLVQAVQSVEDEIHFYELVDDIIANNESEEFQNKARVVKLWGMTYHKHFQNFQETLDSIELAKLMTTKNGAVSIETDEDSFFYLYLAIPNLLHSAGRDDLRVKLDEKMESVKDTLSNQLVKNIGDAISLYYDQKEDCGLQFYEKVLNGEYGDYTYTKSLIGMYKAIVNAQAARLYKDAGNTEAFDGTKEFLQEFAQTNLGVRWLKTLDLYEDVKKADEESDTEVFTITDEKDTKEENK